MATNTHNAGTFKTNLWQFLLLRMVCCTRCYVLHPSLMFDDALSVWTRNNDANEYHLLLTVLKEPGTCPITVAQGLVDNAHMTRPLVLAFLPP